MGLKISAAVYSHIGGRSNNEDNFYLNGVFMDRSQMNRGGQFLSEFSDATQIYAVCDGMGGAEYGEEASLYMTQVLKEYQGECDQPDSSVYLGNMIARASAGIDMISKSKNLMIGDCGSTIAMLVLRDHFFRTVHVGDSRVYRLRGGRLEQLTKDHSEVQRLIDIGEISREEAWQHPLKNVITRHLGMPTDGKPLVPTISNRMDLYPGDRYLICSDGLSDSVHDKSIEDMLCQGDNALNTAAKLVRTALAACQESGVQSDNITVILLDVREIGKRGKEARRVKMLKAFRLLVCALIGCITAGIAYVGFDLVNFLLK